MPSAPRRRYSISSSDPSHYISPTSAPTTNNPLSTPPYYPPTPKAPVYVPPRTTVTYLPLLMQRNPTLWGKNADAFDPGRWIGENGESKLDRLAKEATVFAPFSSGPRIVSPIHSFSLPKSNNFFSVWAKISRTTKPLSFLFVYYNATTRSSSHPNVSLSVACLLSHGANLIRMHLGINMTVNSLKVKVKRGAKEMSGRRRGEEDLGVRLLNGYGPLRR